MRISAFVLSLTLLLSLPSFAQNTPGRIVVTGIGHASAAPDKAVVRIDVSHTDRRTDVAMQDLTQTVEAALATIRAHGIAEDDIETASFSLTEDWNFDGNTRRFDGYEAETRLTVEIRDLTRVGSLITTLSATNGIEIRGPDFELEDKKALRDEARRNAVMDGVATARLLAEAAGVTLGPPLLITDGTENPEDMARRRPHDEVAMEMMEEPVMEEPSAEIAENAVPVIPADISTSEIAKLVFRIDP